MSLLNSYFRSHPPSSCLLCVEHSVRLLNAVLLVAGVTACGLCTKAVINIIHPSADGGEEGVVPPWLWVLDVEGLFTALLATIAIIAVSMRSLRLINAYIVLAALAMSAQLCLAVAVVLKEAKEEGRDSIAVLGILGDETRLYKAACLAGFGMEALALAFTCMLQSAYQSAEDMAEDIADEEADWAGRAPLLPRQPPHVQPGQPLDDEWSARMRERYGLDTSQFTYRPTAGQPRGTGAGPAARLDSSSRGGWCTVM